MADYAKIPANATLDIKPFEAHVDEAKLQHMKQLLELSPIGPAVFENTNAGRKYGLTRAWLENAKEVWLNDFDWRAHEARFNSFPNFKASVKDAEGNVIGVQFLALFSNKADAVPITLLHGWPGSICEFLDMLDLLRKRYPPDDLPYHVIVPSLPGYAYSSGPPVNADYDIELVAGVINQLMTGLGFGSGYITHGGDLGSFVSRLLVTKYEACKGMHVNMMTMPTVSNPAELATTDEEKAILQRAGEMIDTSMGFALLQGQRPATLGLALSSSPLALLCWIGEKMLDWKDGDPPLDKILEGVTLYWLTDTFPRCLYHSRDLGNDGEKPKVARISTLTNMKALQSPYIEKPCGYSRFAYEIVPVTGRWAAMGCNLVFFNQHDRGGHFAAMERPVEMLEDIQAYVKKTWKASG